MPLVRDPVTGEITIEGGDHFGGWIPHELRTHDERHIHDALVGAMPSFKILYGAGETSPDVKKADLTVFTRRSNGGKHFRNLDQHDVGACVGHALAGCCWTLQAVEAYKAGDLEDIIMPYEPYGYAQMRVCAGIGGRSDGGTGSGAAEAAKKFGILDSRLPGLPKFTVTDDEVDFLQTADRQWGIRGAPAEWIEQGVKHPVRTASQCRSTAQAIEALKNGYPILVASNWGGHIDCPIAGGTNPVRLNRRSKDWNHAHYVSSWWDHPELGNIFRHQNSWGVDVHGEPPDDSPRGSFWLQEHDESYILGGGDCYILSGADGFPAAPPNWYMGA